MLSVVMRPGHMHLRYPGVVLVGAPLVDLIAHVDEKFIQKEGFKQAASTPISAEKMNLVLSSLRIPLKKSVGGSALNVAFALARLGGRIAFVGKLGIDYEGWFCRVQMREAGIISWLYVDRKEPTGRVLCLVTPNGERIMLTSLGASNTLDRDEIYDVTFHHMGFAHFEGYQIANRELLDRLMGMAKSKGALISLDMSSSTGVKKHLEAFRYLVKEKVDILFGSYEELKILTELENPETICRFLGSHLRFVFLSYKSKGVYCCVNGMFHYHAVEPIEPFDATGAGDLFCAGVLHGIRSGWDLHKTLELATELSDRVIMVDGAKLKEGDWKAIEERFAIKRHTMLS